MTSARFKSLLAATGGAMTNPALDKAVPTANAPKPHRMATSLSLTTQALIHGSTPNAATSCTLRPKQT